MTAPPQYSRQVYVFGPSGQHRLSSSRLLVRVCGGGGGLLAEALKGVVLAGVGLVHVQRASSGGGASGNAVVTAGDLASNPFVNGGDVGLSLVHTAVRAAQELNPSTSVMAVDAPHHQEEEYHAVLCVNPASPEEPAALTREFPNTPVVVAGVAGLAGYVFADFGKEWTSEDATGETPRSGLIVDALVEGGEFQSEEPHGLEVGAHVRLTSSSLRKFDVVVVALPKHDPARHFAVALLPHHAHLSQAFATEFSDHHVVGYFEELIVPKTMPPHARYVDSLANPVLVPDPLTFDTDRPQRLHLLMQALFDFRARHGGRLPEPGHTQEAAEVMRFVEARSATSLREAARDELLRLAQVSAGHVNPMATFLGGVAAQEILKACSRKHTPLTQWFHFAAPECLPRGVASRYPTLADLSSTVQPGRSTTTTTGQEAVFGTEFQARLSSLHVFLVGAGALGCETLKNLVLMGVRHITITDPDAIEMSNLNRQFLFREAHVGRNKAETARAAVMANLAGGAAVGNCTITAHGLRVESEDVFTDEFWDSVDVVMNALDNLPARFYVDAKCVYYGIPLLEAGTLGTKANTVPIIPHLTESYGSDPVKDLAGAGTAADIPACTLHAYPNVFEHALTWSRDAVFEREFNLNPSEANTFLLAFKNGRVDTYKAELMKQPNSAVERITTARRVLGPILPEDDTAEGLFPYSCPPITSLRQCSERARLLFEQLFHNKIVQLLALHPPGEITPEGKPFWSGKKRAPVPAVFNVHNERHYLFWRSCTTLLGRIHGLLDAAAAGSDVSQVCDPNDESGLLPSNTPTFVPDAMSLRYVPPGEEGRSTATTTAPTTTAPTSSVVDRELDTLIHVLQRGATAIHVERFDKDDDVHIDLVWSAACIRAEAYNIPVQDRLEAKRVVGRIVPAIATTTAAATGLVGLELYKVVQHITAAAPHEHFFRSFNFNLAVNSYATFEPKQCKSESSRFFVGGRNLWHVLTLDGDLTLQQVLDHFKDKYEYSVTSLATDGDVNLYNDVFTPTAVLKERVSLVYERVLGKKPGYFIPLVLDGDFEGDDDQEGDDAEAPPPCRLRWRIGRRV